jgi:hypothetical protein
MISPEQAEALASDLLVIINKRLPDEEIKSYHDLLMILLWACDEYKAKSIGWLKVWSSYLALSFSFKLVAEQVHYLAGCCKDGPKDDYVN